MRLYTAIMLAAAMLFLPLASHGKSMLTDEELLLMEEMQQAGFSKDQIDQVISLKISVRETTKKWSEQELKELDMRLKAHWQAMIKALASDDIDTAVTYFNRDMREIHRILLSATTPEQRDHLLKSLEKHQHDHGQGVELRRVHRQGAQDEAHLPLLQRTDLHQE